METAQEWGFEANLTLERAAGVLCKSLDNTPEKVKRNKVEIRIIIIINKVKN